MGGSGHELIQEAFQNCDYGVELSPLEGGMNGVKIKSHPPQPHRVIAEVLNAAGLLARPDGSAVVSALQASEMALELISDTSGAPGLAIFEDVIDRPGI